MDMREAKYPGLFLQEVAFTCDLFTARMVPRKSISDLTLLLGLHLQSPTCAALLCVFSVQKYNTWNTYECSLQHSPCQQSLNCFSLNSWNISLKHFRAGICSHISCQASVNCCAPTSPTCIGGTHGRHQVADDQMQYLPSLVIYFAVLES